MSKSTKTIALISESLILAIGIVWFFRTEEREEPLIVIIMAIAAIIGSLVYFNNNANNDEKSSPKKIRIKQKAGKKSTQYASGGDMTINEGRKDNE
ncbi:hypothetical protein [uncultured Aquimarina sp.]|uniref:hypothetical protein n=1 Tax=uncultured Aquimarina sp. TaxID=575652 RepID=UPI0026129BED|nr:hypothetical protein [uncultured Aquimarina sp.]